MAQSLLGASQEPVSALLAQFGVPLSADNVRLAEAFADYAWASDTPGGKEAAKYMSGLRILSLLYGYFLTGDGDDTYTLQLIALLRAETIKSITEYVSTHQRTPKKDVEAEVQRRLSVFAQQVMLIDQGIITWKGGAAGAGVTFPDNAGTGPSYKPPPPASSGPGPSGRGGGGRAPEPKPTPSSTAQPKQSKPTSSGSSSGGGGLFGLFDGSKSSSSAEKEKPKKPAPSRSDSSRSSSEASKSRTSVQEPVARAAATVAVHAAPPPKAAAAKQASPEPAPAPRPEPVIVQTPVKGLHPTVLPATDFDVDADVQALRKAMKGMGCDDKAVIKVLAYRSNGQRQEISKKFKATIGKDLPSELEGELRGNMEDVALGLMKTSYEYDAYLLRMAMKGMGTDEAVLIEILASRTSAHLNGVSQCFQRMYGRDLQKDVKSETSGDFRSLLVGRLAVKRSDGGEVDMTLALDDAQRLYDAGEAKRGTDEATFIEIFMQRSNAHLNATSAEYAKISKKSLEDAIKNETSGDLCSLLKAILRCAQDTQMYFAELMYKAMKGAGTNDSRLIRCIVSRCEVDMVEIKQAYQQRHGKTLADDIEGDTGGNYKRFLLALIAEA